MLASIALAPLNHLLRGESWARQQLRPYAGKTARFRIPPFFDLALSVQASGEMGAAASNAAIDATLTLTPGLLPRLLARDEEAYREIRVSGDGAFAEELIHVGRNLRWDVEEDLSRVMGDVLAHRMTQAGDNLAQWQRETLHNLSQALLEYWTEEQPLLAKPVHVRAFIHEVGILRDEVEQLERRIERLRAGRSL